jgi:hypothetical protein
MFKKFAILNNEIRAFSTYFDKQTEKYSLYAHRISKNGEMDKNPIVLSSYSGKDKYNTSYEDSYNVAISPDKKRILTYYVSFPVGSKSISQPKLFAILLNEKLEKEWEQEIAFPLKGDMSLEEVRVTNKGDVLAIIDSYTPQSKQSRSRLYHFNAEKKAVAEYPINKENAVAFDIRLDITPKNHLIVTGFYSGKNANRAEGLFFHDIDLSTGEESVATVTAFPKDFLAIVPENKKGKDDEGLKNLHVRKVLPLKDGRTIILVEDYRISVMRNNNSLGYGYSSSDSKVFNYEDIYVIELDKNATWNRSAKILKYQKTMDDNGMFNSFASIISDEELVLIYNANSKDPDERMTNTLNATVYSTTLNLSSFTATTKKVFNAKEYKIIATPKFIYQEEGADNIIMHGKDVRYFRFFRVSL